MEFGQKIKLVRNVLNLSQENLAKELNVSFATINRLENGKTLPSYKTIKNFGVFCDKYKMPLREVYEELK